MTHLSANGSHRLVSHFIWMFLFLVAYAMGIGSVTTPHLTSDENLRLLLFGLLVFEAIRAVVIVLQSTATTNIGASKPDVGESGWGTTLNSALDTFDATFHGSTGHDHSGGTGEGPKISLTGSVSGILPFANGGTGTSSDQFDASTGHDHSGVSGEGPQLSLTAAVSGILPSANGGTGTSSDQFHASTGHDHTGASGEGPLLSLTAAVSGILPVANGGSGVATLDCCHLRHSTTQSITNDSSLHDIAFDNEIVDVGGLHSNSSNNERITIARSGMYLIVGNIRFTDDTSGTFRLLAVRLNGTDIGGTTYTERPSGSTTSRMELCLVYPLTAGQYITLALSHNMSGSSTVNVPYFSAFRLGPTS